MDNQSLKRRWEGADHSSLPRVPGSMCEVAQRVGKLIAAKESKSYKAHRGVEYDGAYTDSVTGEDFVYLRIFDAQTLIRVKLKIESVVDEYGTELWEGGDE